MVAAVRVALLTAALSAAVPAVAGAAGGYRRCPAPSALEFARVARTGCADVAAAVTAVAAQPVSATGPALRASGWTPVHAVQTARASFDVVAIRHRAVLRIRRRGAAPDLDGWEAGRELLFARARLVGGKPVPRGAALCTSSFLVRWSGTFHGLTAAHCGGLRRDGSVERRHAALRRPPQPGIVLGRVRAIVTRHAPYDALVLRAPSGSGRSALPVVDRGITRPPWLVRGFARPFADRRVCFSGRTSGPDHCGRILGRSSRSTQLGAFFQLGVLVVCTDIRAAEGDSGGPVYTPGTSQGSVNAVGLVTLISGATRRMCFTPLAPVLNRLHATLVTG